MKELDRIYCDAYDKYINDFDCENCCIKKRYNIPPGKCRYYGEYIVQVLKLKADNMRRLKKISNKKGGNPVSHYIREAIAEYIDKYE